MTKQNNWDFDTSYNVGDILYANSSTTLAKLPIGSDQDSLNVLGGALQYSPLPQTQDMVLVEEQTVSNVAQVSFLNLGSYFYYLLFINNCYGSGGQRIDMQFSINNGATYQAANYEGGNTYYEYGSFSTIRNLGVNQTAQINISPAGNSSLTNSLNGLLYISAFNSSTVAPTLVGHVTFYSSAHSNFAYGNPYGMLTGTATPRDAFRVFATGGNIYGNFKLYGLPI